MSRSHYNYKWHLTQLIGKKKTCPHTVSYIFFRVVIIHMRRQSQRPEVDDPLFPYSLLAGIECMFHSNLLGEAR